MALYVGAASLGMQRGHGFPRWLAALGTVVVLTCLAAAAATGTTGPLQESGPVAVISLLLLLVWTLATGITLTRRPRRRTMA